MSMSRFLTLILPVVAFVLLLGVDAHAAAAAPAALGQGLIATLTWWCETVIAPGLILVGILITAGSFLAGGARQGLMMGVGTIIAGVLLYSGPAVVSFVKAAAH